MNRNESSQRKSHAFNSFLEKTKKKDLKGLNVNKTTKQGQRACFHALQVHCLLNTKPH